MFYTIHSIQRDRNHALALTGGPKSPEITHFTSKALCKLLNINEWRLRQLAHGRGQTRGIIISHLRDNEVPELRMEMNNYLRRFKVKYIPYNKEGNLSHLTVEQRLYGCNENELVNHYGYLNINLNKAMLKPFLPTYNKMICYRGLTLVVATSYMNAPSLADFNK